MQQQAATAGLLVHQNNVQDQQSLIPEDSFVTDDEIRWALSVHPSQLHQLNQNMEQLRSNTNIEPYGNNNNDTASTLEMVAAARYLQQQQQQQYRQQLNHSFPLAQEVDNYMADMRRYSILGAAMAEQPAAATAQQQHHPLLQQQQQQQQPSQHSLASLQQDLDSLFPGRRRYSVVGSSQDIFAAQEQPYYNMGFASSSGEQRALPPEETNAYTVGGLYESSRLRSSALAPWTTATSTRTESYHSGYDRIISNSSNNADTLLHSSTAGPYQNQQQQPPVSMHHHLCDNHNPLPHMSEAECIRSSEANAAAAGMNHRWTDTNVSQDLEPFPSAFHH